MYIGVKSVKPMKEYKLLITFENDEQRIFDMKSYLDRGIFAQLRDEALFASVHVSFDTVEWSNGADLCPEVLYKESMRLQSREDVSEKVLA